MNSIPRRQFLQQTGLGAGALLLRGAASAQGQAASSPSPEAGGGAAGNLSLKRILLTEDHLVMRTAAAELNRTLGTHLEITVSGVPTAGDAVITRVSNPVARPLVQGGWTNLHNIAPEQDGYHVLERDGVVWFLGSSWRGALQGVHGLTAGPECPDLLPGVDFAGSFSFSTRIFSPIMGSGLFNPQTSPPPVMQACMRYLSRIGASHVALTNDFDGGPPRDMYSYVESTILPHAIDPKQRDSYRKSLRAMIDAAKIHGLDCLFDARMLPCQGGPWVPAEARQSFLGRYPAEILSDSGTYQGKVLCFGHPTVQAFYQEVIANFFRDFPEINLFHYLTLDDEGEFCDSHTCPRCKGLSEFDQRDRLAKFMEHEMTRARPGLRILNTSFQWDRDGFGFDQLLSRQSALPAAVGLCLSATGDSATFERQSHDQLRQAREVTRRAGQLVIGRDAMHFFEDQLFSGANHRFDYPLGIFAKIRRWQDLGYDGFYDVRGRISPDDLHANSPACRAALLDPSADAHGFVDALTLKWFGKDAGPVVADAWRLLERAQAIRSNGYAFPSSSPLCEYVPWHFERAFTPVPTNPRFTTQVIPQESPNYGELVPVQANGYIYHAGDYPRRLDTTGRCITESAVLLLEAASLLDRARKLSLPACLEDASSWLGANAGQSPRDYLDSHFAFISSGHYFGAIMGPYFMLKSLRMRLGDDVVAYRAQAAPLLATYVSAAGALATWLEEQMAQGGIKSVKGSGFTPEILRAKAKEVTEYLAATTSPPTPPPAERPPSR